MGAERKPTVAELGLDVDALVWQGAGARRAGAEPDAGAIEVAFAAARGQTWALMRVAGDPSGLVLVYDRYEWECFVDGAKNGEFDDAADCER